MPGESTTTRSRRIRLSGFPWPSLFAGLVTLAYFFFATDPGLIRFYDLSEHWFREESRYAVLAAFLLLLLLDLRRCQHQRKQNRLRLDRLQDQLDELWERNRQLRLKAHTYSGHADKLKYFISEKLLEYIEYDEKFLHFKGIAAEVRHNGVISFDKVQSALQRGIDETPEDQAESYRLALASMRYLWDLLDLSTADNLALHIGNHLCECEEHYCQRLLNTEAGGPLSDEAAYRPQKAAWRALSHVHPELAPLPEDGDYQFRDTDWSVHLEPAGELLGNENHLVLLLDNLLKNAQFFSRKARGRKEFPPIALSLTERAGYVILRVYNRGPRIPETEREHLFQLGYSTRRSREDHGRGLGLYFVNEIVKGYEGEIRIENIEPPEACYLLEIELDNGEQFQCSVETRHDGHRWDYRPDPPKAMGPPPDQEDGNEEHPAVRLAPDGQKQGVTWHLDAPLRRVRIIHPDEDTQAERNEFGRRGRQDFIDPDHPEAPHWRIAYHPARKGSRLVFQSLDIGGVAFEVHLPTARHRIEGQEEIAEDTDMDAEVERLDEQFRSPE